MKTTLEEVLLLFLEVFSKRHTNNLQFDDHVERNRNLEISHDRKIELFKLAYNSYHIPPYSEFNGRKLREYFGIQGFRDELFVKCIKRLNQDWFNELEAQADAYKRVVANKLTSSLGTKIPIKERIVINAADVIAESNESKKKKTIAASEVARKIDKDKILVFMKQNSQLKDADLARFLNKNKVPTFTGRKWSHANVKNMRDRYFKSDENINQVAKKEPVLDSQSQLLINCLTKTKDVETLKKIIIKIEKLDNKFSKIELLKISNGEHGDDASLAYLSIVLERN